MEEKMESKCPDWRTQLFWVLENGEKMEKQTLPELFCEHLSQEGCIITSPKLMEEDIGFLAVSSSLA